MAKRRRRKSSRLDPTLSRAVIAVVLIIVAVIIMLSFFNKAGVLGVILNDYVLSALFGSIRYTTPIVFLIIAFFVLKDIEYDYRPTHAIGALLFFISMSSLMHMGMEPYDMWRQALNGHGGGIFGMLAWPLKSYLGIIASFVILIGLTIVSILLIFNTSITAFVMLHKKLFIGLGIVGQWILNLVKTLFVRNGKHVRFKIKGDYDEYEEEEEEGEEDEDDEEEDEKRKRGFFRRRLLSKNYEEEEDEEDEDDEEENEEEDEEDEEEDEKEDENNKNEKDNIGQPDEMWSKSAIIKKIPSTQLLASKRGKPTSGDIKANAEIIRSTLSEFGVDVTMGGVRVGPTVTQYSLKPAKGVKLARITALSNDLSLALAAHPIRIEAPIPGKSLVGIEVPNQKTALVTLKELLEAKEFKKRPHNTMIALGKDVAGKVWFADLTKMPHLLIAGATGSGKTVCINTIIMSLLYQNKADELRMIMIDPKRVELTLYTGIPHLLTPVITNTQKTINSLRWTIAEMDRRFEILSQTKSRDLDSYNNKYPNNKMPRVIFIIDELADLMATAANEVEAGIIRLAQMARAVGIHLILATQRPSVDVITGLMKANIPARVAFSVASLVDSRTILDMPGAEKLLGRGDMLFLTAELSKPVRIQSSFISEEELKNVVDYLRGDEEPVYDEAIIKKQSSGGTLNLFGGQSDDRDPLFEEARRAILQAGKASASFLQRRLKIGYARAARILDEMEEAGIVGPGDGAKPREILTSVQEENRSDAGGEYNEYDDEEDEYNEEE